MTRNEMKALVKAKRDEWANTYVDIDDDGLLDVLVDSLMVPAVLAEREACARVCEDHAKVHEGNRRFLQEGRGTVVEHNTVDLLFDLTSDARLLAKLIRSRTTEDQSDEQG